MYSEKLDGKIFIGEVVNIDDPNKEYRCKIRVFSVFDEVPEENLPWAYPLVNQSFSSDTSGSGSCPKIGSLVYVIFMNGNIYNPFYLGGIKLSEYSKNIIQDSYQDSHILLSDEKLDLRVYYTEQDGFSIKFKSSQITINNDESITIEDKNNNIIEIFDNAIKIVSQSNIDVTANNQVNITANSECNIQGVKNTNIGPNPVQGISIHEILWQFLKTLAAQVDTKYPTTPGLSANLAENFEKLSKSNNIKISF